MTLILMIMDGWGYSEKKNYNAIHLAHTPQWDEWWHKYPHMILNASGSHVGLPENQMGSSEVGHMHIGAGRIIEQSLTRINKAIDNGELATNARLLETLSTLKKTNKSLHLLGLLSAGGVHSHQAHLFALLKICHQQNFNSVFLHLFLDGIDTPKQSALQSIASLQDVLKKHPVAQIKSIVGRHFAMAGKQHWDRIEPVYRLLTQSQAAFHFADVRSAIEAYYQQAIDDPFIPATLIGSPKAIEDGDALLYFNFRADRARQLTTAFLQPSFTGFERGFRPTICHFLSMTQYAETLNTKTIFPPVTLKNTLGEMIAKHGMRQLRIAETEKYLHTTSFFNGGVDTPFNNEHRMLIPSSAATNLTPQMNANALTQALLNALDSRLYDVIICNYANADVLGHTGNLTATLKAVEYLDKSLFLVGKAIAKQGGHLLITADHGNAEMMYDEITQKPYNAHTTNPVPFLYVGQDYRFKKQTGSLIHVAPVVLSLLGIKPPPEMVDEILIEKVH